MIVLFWGQTLDFEGGPTILIGFFEACRGLKGATTPAWLCLGPPLLDLLAESGKLGAKLAETPIEQNHGLYIGSGELLQDKKIYQRLVGKLIYLTVARRDISYVVYLVSQFMYALRIGHLTAAHRILRYLKWSPGQGILYISHGRAKAMAYIDADWAGSFIDWKSTTVLYNGWRKYSLVEK